MPIRVECTSEGLENCYVEVSERWTRNDIQALFEPGAEAALVRRKVTACYLECVDADAITDASAIYDADGKLHPDLDVRLINFVPAALIMAVDRIASLGKVNARLSSAGTGRAATMTPATTTETTQAA